MTYHANGTSKCPVCLKEVPTYTSIDGYTTHFLDHSDPLRRRRLRHLFRQERCEGSGTWDPVAKARMDDAIRRGEYHG